MSDIRQARHQAFADYLAVSRSCPSGRPRGGRI
jgi:hypothetical protein